ncbi:MAG: phage portal protein [Candidatus Dehalobacter alkaniphilus]|jgi:SPP1 family phage portal protein
MMFGREVIYSSESVITKANVVDVLTKALSVHNRNQSEIAYLYKYYKGNQPILRRKKTIRPEINNKIVENHALEIVDFKKGYVFGEPVQYVRRGETEGVSEKITQLNEFMFAEDKAARDKELAEWFYICGTAYRMVLPDSALETDESPFELDTLDPRYTFVVYNNGFGKKPLMGVKYIDTDTGILYSIYTPTVYFEVRNGIVEKEEAHVLKDIPIIEYPANNARLGAFEVVLGLLDALNNTASNRMDGIEQFIQAFMKFVNCDIDEVQFAALKEMGAIKIKGEPGNPADVGIVSSELNQTQTQVTKDDIYQMILIICGMPDRNGANRTTGDTGQAVILRDGWSAAESRARDSELVFKKSEKQFLRLVLRICKDASNLELRLSDIDIKFTRNKTDNLLVKTQGLQNMLEAGVHPQIAITNSGLFSDPEQTYLDSLPYLAKWLAAQATSTPSNNKPNPDGKQEEPEVNV